MFIGFLTILKNRHTSQDYLLAGGNVKPWLVALSAVATNNSGYMFVGMIGFTYLTGLSSIWLMIGWISGDFLASLFIHHKIRITTEKQNVLSFAGVLSKWNNTDYRKLRFLGGLITFIFLGTYAAAQLKAGSKALHVLFGWDYAAGAIIGAFMVLLYCFVGGLRASIWTDAAQSAVMLFAMGLLVYVAVDNIGGVNEFHNKLASVSPNYLNIFPKELPCGVFFGPVLFVLSWMFSGFGVIGQPHIMVRFMAMNHPKEMNKVRLYYYSWYTAFYFLTILAGLSARVLLPEVNNFDAELALPTLANHLLPEILVGLILAGLFAATMSTADSQILSCTAALTRDFTQDKMNNYIVTKIGTVVVTLTALSIALFGSENVFGLVLIAWSALASSFAPILTVYALNQKPSEGLTLAMIASGLITVLTWRCLGYTDFIYEIMPGILVSLMVFLIGKKLGFCKKS